MAGAQVASRRKAQHGSSRTVFHEGSDLSPGDTSAPTEVRTRGRPVLFQPRKSFLGQEFRTDGSRARAVGVSWGLQISVLLGVRAMDDILSQGGDRDQVRGCAAWR